MKPVIIFLAALVFSLGSLAQKAKKPAVKQAVKAVNKPVSTPEGNFKNFPNGISMSIKGFKIAEAGLYFEDGTKVPEGNMIELEQKVIMYAVIDSGYKTINGKVFPGGSQRIVLANGYEVLKTDDLFAFYNEGVKAEDGKYISLKAKMTQIDDKNQEITISFKIWDKKSSSNITGNYKLHIK